MKVVLIALLLALQPNSTGTKMKIDETIAEDPTDYPQFDEVLFELPIAASPTQ